MSAGRSLTCEDVGCPCVAASASVAFKAKGEEDDGCCPVCHTAVSVPAGLDPTPGELCNTCLRDQYNILRADNVRLASERDIEHARLIEAETRVKALENDREQCEALGMEWHDDHWENVRARQEECCGGAECGDCPDCVPKAE